MAANAICSIAASTASERLNKHINGADIAEDSEHVESLKIDRPSLPSGAELSNQVSAGLAAANQRRMASSTGNLMRAFGGGFAEEGLSQLKHARDETKKYLAHPYEYDMQQQEDKIISAFNTAAYLYRGDQYKDTVNAIKSFYHADGEDKAKMLGKGALHLTEGALAFAISRKVGPRFLGKC